MARLGLSYQDILNAINILQKENNKPSINNIRKTIGKGSPTTISKFLKQWKDTQNKLLDDNIDNQDSLKNNKEQPNILYENLLKEILDNSQEMSHDIYNNMSNNEWEILLKEKNLEIKTRKLYAALVKEQIRRQSAENCAKDAKIYAEKLKEQTTKRINDLRTLLENQIAFLNSQIIDLKKDSEKNVEFYRKQLEKSNNIIAKKYN